MAMVDSELDVVIAELYRAIPAWVLGHISLREAQFLAQRTLAAETETVVEIGTASGVSTAAICRALRHANAAGRVGPDYRVVSYDISPRFYGDQSRQVGDATRELLPPELLKHVDLRNPATALDVRAHHGQNEIKLMFIDASHEHPWPTLDLLASLESLRVGAEVVLHDINLPILHPQWQAFGAKYLFDDLATRKRSAMATSPPNIGSVTIPADKEYFRRQLLAILDAHEWETEVNPEVVNCVLHQ
jgi:predicted O-methyltransferase YrrM